MRLTPMRLVLFRLYSLTVGRLALCDRVLRAVLEYLIVWRKKPEDRYTATAGFFDVRDLEGGEPPP